MSENVAEIDDHESKKRPRNRNPDALLERARDLAAEHLVKSLPTMMDKVDDYLFDLVSKSDNQAEHGAYMDVMRDMRVKRPDIESKFRSQYVDLVNQAIRRAANPEAVSASPAEKSLTLGLVSEDDYEEALAVTNMVTKVKGNCAEELFALEKRVAHLLKVEDLPTEANPLGPEAICLSFKDACGLVDASLDVRLVILKLFDRHVVSEALEIYEQINGLFVDNGVLPEIRAKVVKQPGSQRRSNGAESPADSAQAPMASNSQADAGLVNTLQQLLQVNLSAAAGGGGGPGLSPQALGGLTRLQHGDVTGGEFALPNGVDLSALSGEVNVLRDLKATPITEGLPHVDVVMFDVVAMMFDFILDDRNVPDAMKALIGRLQIPLLKVAILDKEFFAKKNHPARRLLNAFAEAAVGWSEGSDENKGLYAEMERLVLRVLDEFEDSLEVFSEALEELNEFVGSANLKAETNATATTEVLQEQERLNHAKQRADEEVEDRLKEADKEIAPFVKDFLKSQWKELLVFHYYQQGESEGWDGAVKTMDDLLWSVTEKDAAEARKELLGALPKLLSHLKAGMDQIGTAETTRGNFLATLADVHLSLIKPGQGAKVVAKQPAPTAPPTGLELIRRALENANEIIYQTARTRPQCQGMGTTVVAAHFVDDRMRVAHVGDSRLYLYREDSLSQITVDHSLMQELIEKGFYTAEEARERVKKNIITRAVGIDEKVRADVQEVAVSADDVVLLCSDGLTDLVEDSEIHEVVKAHLGDLGQAGSTLVELANSYGGKDNISVVFARVKEACAVEMAGVTDVGRKRSHNEDGIAMDTKAGIALVADGMGGCNAGEVASAMAIDIIIKALGGGELTQMDEVESEVSSGDDVEAFLQAVDAAEDATTSKVRSIVDPQNKDLVEQMDVGTWVEFRHPNGVMVRGRLSWVSAESGRYLFTDREGVKVVDASPYGLAIEFQRGNAQIINDAPLVERVLDNVNDRIQSGDVELGPAS